MVHNIIDKNRDGSLAAMSALKSEEAFETRAKKASVLFDCYRLDTKHNLSDKW